MLFQCWVDHMLGPNVLSMFDNIKTNDCNFFHIWMCCIRESNIEWMFTQCANKMLKPNVATKCLWMFFQCWVDHILEPNVWSMFDNIKSYDCNLFHIWMFCMRESNIDRIFEQCLNKILKPNVETNCLLNVFSMLGRS